MNNCFEYLIDANYWLEIDPLDEPRKSPTSSLDEDGNLWVMGGTTGGSSAITTEVYIYERQTWTRGYDLPPALRDTGIESHCTVR